MRAEDSADWVRLRNGLWLHKYEETVLPEQVYIASPSVAQQLNAALS
jgi:hypothetical protein